MCHTSTFHSTLGIDTTQSVLSYIVLSSSHFNMNTQPPKLSIRENCSLVLMFLWLRALPSRLSWWGKQTDKLIIMPHSGRFDLQCTQLSLVIKTQGKTTQSSTLRLRGEVRHILCICPSNAEAFGNVICCISSLGQTDWHHPSSGRDRLRSSLAVGWANPH